MKQHPIDRLVAYSLNGGFPQFIFIMAIFLGAIALTYTPREEEPQIVVPMIDVWVDVPNLSARQVERQVTVPLEKLIKQVPGIEHIYSASHDGGLSVTLRFEVGQDRERALLNTYNKLHSNQDNIPEVAENWIVKPIEVDDVAILTVGLYSTAADLYSDYELRRMAQEVSTVIQSLPNTSEVNIVGGRSRQIQVQLDLQALAARQTSVMNVVDALALSNQLARHGEVSLGQETIVLESGDVIRDLQALNNIVVNVINGKMVLLKDIATISDGPSEPTSYQWLEFASAAKSTLKDKYPMVTISVAKQKGSNAVTVANDVLAKMAELETQLLPKEVRYEYLRNYGQTANEKVNNLTSSLAFAVFTVVVFIGVFLGWRQAIVVALAVPICYGLTLMLDFAFGYTINRVTLFALILSLGLLVDDPITGIDNITRFLGNKNTSKKANIIEAMSEIRPALIMSTITIILAFVPLAFITGMMGPYMAPMAFNVPVSVVISTFVAFAITPWLAAKLLKPSNEPIDDNKQGLYSRLLNPLIAQKGRSKLGLWLVLVLFIISCALPLMRSVPLKLLPFDNKNELQVLIDMPEGTSLEKTAATVEDVIETVKLMPEVKAIASYIGQPSPIDFNGMVRQHYLRQAPNLAELRVTLLDKTLREHQSHGIVLRLREQLASLQQAHLSIKVIEVPPGPPVLSTFVAEIYAEPFVSPQVHQDAALGLMARLKAEAHVVEVDSTINSEQQIWRFVTDKQKAALSGISTVDINNALGVAVASKRAGTYQVESDATPVPIEVKLHYENRQSLTDILGLQVLGQNGIAQQNNGLGLESSPQSLVSLAELGQWQQTQVSQPILHKDLVPVIYVTAELSGRTPAEVISDLSADLDSDTDNPSVKTTEWENRTYLQAGGGASWQLPEGTSYSFSGEGEWKITIDVFRDMGIAFAFALVAIFFLLKLQTSSSALALIIMSAIPLTIIGIMPGFWLLNQFGERSIAGAPDPILFTATAMIGMIALAGIVVRNSLILVEFITLARDKGMNIKQALLAAGEVRMRPVLLTAGTTMLGNLVITLDPVFSGLALAIIFGIIASTLFSLFVVPMVYYLVFEDTPLEPLEEHRL
ncbi:efflux RND transporter permease subunit [uncultured Paraglaciecola sp.]|uniref:efflux RND transporter permease subunit n=1 Tax=uncultured Paraglaciecola sp. TaxID=1765024 RepID=UPI0030D70386|tara:strand:+ start:151443 stop:154751 length:3309 start_codon:yes stop_codon:yes gene_type:complete